MRWTERQRAMLRAMGLRVGAPAGAEAGQDEPEVDVDEPRTGSPAAPRAATLAAAPAMSRDAKPAAAPVRPAPAAPRAATPALPARAAGAPVDASQLGWPELREAVAGCTACVLCERRTQTVFGVGHERAHWMIVGEAPGEQEDREGEPFIGKSGQLLDNMLRAIGLSREAGPPETQVYIANAVKCRPPSNRNPAPQELSACEGFLVRQIELVQPKVILAMGAFAVQSLLRSTEPIGRLRGTVHRYQGVPLIVTYHPAYLLRNLQDKARAWDDLCLAVECVQASMSH